MTVIYMIFPLLLMTSIPVSDSFDTDSNAGEHCQTIEGVLRLYGNEPFTRVTLVTDEEVRYYFLLEDEELSRLWIDQKDRIRITGTVIEKYHLGKPARFINDIITFEWIVEEK